MPAFNGPLNHSDSTAMLIELAAHGVRGIGIFNNVSERNSLSSAVRSSPYLAYMCNDDKLYVYDGPRNNINGLTDKQQTVLNSDWTDTSNWTEVGAGSGNEVNDLSSSVTWVDVPSGNITEGSVTQHEAALTIGQGQVSGLGSVLTTLQSATTTNGSAITTLQGADTTLQNNITAVNTTISGLDTDDITEGSTNLYYTTGKFDTAFSAKSTDDLSEGSTNLYNVQADWLASGTAAEIQNKPSLFDGNYNSLSNKPSLFDGEYGSLASVPSTFVPSAHSHAISEITNLQTSLDGKVDDSQVLTDVPSGAVFTDTTYSVQDGELSQNNFTDALKTNLGNQSGTNSGDQDLTSYQLQPSEGAFADGDKTKLDGIDEQAITDNTTHRGLTNNPHDTSILNLTDTPASFGSYKNVLTVNQNADGLVYSDLIEEITNQVLDLVNSSSSYTQNSADLDGDGVVGTEDLLLLLAQYGTATNTPFAAAWHLDDSNSSLPYTGSGNEGTVITSPSDSTTNLLILEAPSQVSAYAPWTITTNINNETVSIAQSNGSSAESVEYGKKIKFIEAPTITIQQTSVTSNVYTFFLKTVYSYPTAADLTIWHNIGGISFDQANYTANGASAQDKSLFGTLDIPAFFDHENGGEYPSSATMSFRYMKSAQEGDSYIRLKNVNFQWIS